MSAKSDMERDIITMFNCGATKGYIGKLYGISKQGIGRIIKRNRDAQDWAEVVVLTKHAEKRLKERLRIIDGPPEQFVKDALRFGRMTFFNPRKHEMHYVYNSYKLIICDHKLITIYDRFSKWEK